MSTPSFSTFVEAPSNRAARQALLDVATRPDASCDPLLIYGPCGSGKSHLLRAAARHLASHAAELEVFYVDALMLFRSSDRRDRADSAASSQGSVDVLLIDNIQFAPPGPSAERLLARTVSDAKRLVMCCDCPPEKLAFPEGLLAGMTCIEIGKPEAGVAAAVLRKAVRRAGFEVPEEVAAYVADLAGHDIREVEGVANLLIESARLRGCEIDEALSASVLKRFLDVA